MHALICVTWLIREWDMTHSYVRHDPFISDSQVRHSQNLYRTIEITVAMHAVTCVIWLIHKWDITYSYVNMTYLHALHKTIKNQSRPTFRHVCDMSHSHVQHDSFIRAIWLIHMTFTRPSKIKVAIYTAMCMTSLIRMCDMTHSYLRHTHSYKLHKTIEIKVAIHAVMSHVTEPRRDADLYMWHDSFIHSTWLTHILDMNHSRVGHDSFLWPPQDHRKSESPYIWGGYD